MYEQIMVTYWYSSWLFLEIITIVQIDSDKYN